MASIMMDCCTATEALQYDAQASVKPSTMLRSHVIAVPPVDTYMLRINVPHLLFFRLDPELDRREVFGALRCGLSDALVEFPFLAGHVVLKDPTSKSVEVGASHP